ncbi:TlpA family protein disulfide reductase [Psychroserpens ponticola]|uniref:Redoxin family protein n=1 Tax=Psychroserpens ponticola TaxID=2932268 RepID=A0ABY7S057_9FLAO|nr:TlpA family protein disulfide reductase [Psychroserpens ponticola]WCO02774.1 redoxin family protein [Psychroserpens ponticola]
MLDLKRIADYGNAFLYFVIMARSKKSKIYNLIFLIVIALLLIPQTRQPIQVFINKGITLIVKPSVIDHSERKILSSYDWELRGISETNFDFNSAKEKVVVINFWATWCPPCIAEMPSMEELYQNYKDNEDVVFLFVSNEEVSVIEKFMSKKEYSFNVYQSVTEHPKEFNVSSIPRTFVISKTGEIVIDKTGPADWNSDAVTNTIDELLKAF